MSDSNATLPAVLTSAYDRKVKKLLGNRVHSVVETSKPLTLNKDLSLDHFEVYKKQI